MMIGKAIDTCIRSGPTSLLKRHGYRKAGRTFHFHGPDYVRVVNVQASKWNEGTSGSFTVNLGVFHPAVSQLTNALNVSDPPKEYDCTVRKRLGMVMSSVDRWWEITTETDLALVGQEIATALDAHGLPWLEDMSRIELAREELERQGMLFQVAAIHLLAGRRPLAQAALKRYLVTHSKAAPRTLSWAREHGLSVSA